MCHHWVTIKIVVHMNSSIDVSQSVELQGIGYNVSSRRTGDIGTWVSELQSLRQSFRFHSKFGSYRIYYKGTQHTNCTEARNRSIKIMGRKYRDLISTRYVWTHRGQNCISHKERWSFLWVWSCYNSKRLRERGFTWNIILMNQFHWIYFKSAGKNGF